jgi:23S rRNA (cytidine2498-2'-O)-methyltransferase
LAFATPLAQEIERALYEAAPESLTKLKKSASGGSLPARRRASPHGGLVLDVFVLDPGEWWVGYHRAVTTVERWPGGHIPVHLPAHAVSRAYAKLQEAIAWSNLPIAAGDECVEIGCAPGGACQALLERGLFVTGIDPADVDPILLECPRFRHLKKRGKDVRRSEFLGVRWLVADMNIAPQATLDEVEPIVMHPGMTIRGLVLTLKLSDWSAAEELDAFSERVRGWGYRDVRMRQLVSGGQEVCLVALRRKALRRLGRALSRKRGRRRLGAARLRKGDDVPTAAGRRADNPHSELSGPHF